MKSVKEAGTGQTEINAYLMRSGGGNAPNVPDFKPPYHIAIYQKINGDLMHITDFPDGKYPHTSQDLRVLP